MRLRIIIMMMRHALIYMAMPYVYKDDDVHIEEAAIIMKKMTE